MIADFSAIDNLCELSPMVFRRRDVRIFLSAKNIVKYFSKPLDTDTMSFSILVLRKQERVKNMELQTASQVSQNYSVSTRMLRYYEQMGLVESNRKDDYAYRVYDEDALKRLQQIIILRKMQIPVKKISVILNNPDAATAIEISRRVFRNSKPK